MVRDVEVWIVGPDRTPDTEWAVDRALAKTGYECQSFVDQLAQIVRQLTDVVAERAKRPSGDFAVATLAGAILGVMISAEFYWVEHPGTDLVALLDEALANLESGLPL